jgi:hypothetical protein
MLTIIMYVLIFLVVIPVMVLSTFAICLVIPYICYKGLKHVYLELKGK